MKKHLVLVSALDTLLILFITILIAFGAVIYDENKGIGKDTYKPINVFEIQNISSTNKRYEPHFFALALSKDIIKVIEIKNGEALNEKNYEAEFMNTIPISQLLEKNIPFIIYDEEKSRYLGDLVRLLSKLNVDFGVASP